MKGKRLSRNIAAGGRWIFGGIFAAVAFQIFNAASGSGNPGPIEGAMLTASLALLLGLIFYWFDVNSGNPEVDLSGEALDDIADRLGEREEDNDA